MPDTRSKKEAIKNMDSKIDKVADRLQSELRKLKETVATGEGVTDSETVFADFERRMMQSLNKLRSELADLKSAFARHMEDVNRKSYADYVIVHGMAEKADEDLYTELCNVFNSKIGVVLSKEDFAICYRLGKKAVNVGDKRGRPVAVKFLHRWKRNGVYNNKKKLKGSGLVISEMLTKSVRDLFKVVKQYIDVKKCWTWKGDIYISTDSGRKRIDSASDIPGYNQ